MKKLVLFGLGKIADVALQHFLRDGEFEVVALCCDSEWIGKGQAVDARWPVLPFETIEQHFDPAQVQMHVALGYHDLNGLRAARAAQARAKGYRLANLISRRADVGPWLQLGDNCMLLDGVGVQPGARIGNNVSIWNHTLIGHHSVIEDDVWIAAGATLGGSVRIGARSFIGLNATIGGEAQLGAQCFVGGGALVLKSAPDKSVFVQPGTDRFRLDSTQFLRMTRMPVVGPG